MIEHIGEFLGGLVLLLVGGRLLVSASVDTARRLDVSPLVVGLTLVAWGTSAPELALNITSALKGRGGLAFGNVVGANICNMALSLGVCAMLRPLVVQQRLLRVEIWLNMGVLCFLAALGLMAGLRKWNAGLMLGVFGAYSMWTVMSAMHKSRTSRSEKAADFIGEDPMHPKPPMGWFMIGAAFIGGLALLTFGGSLASDGASGVALAMGIPAALVGVTVVSIGTTLPELVTGVLAVRKGQTDLAMGNALGSCLFNGGAIFGAAGLIAPSEPGASMTVPLVYMAVLAIALVPISRSGHKTVSRVEGALLLGSYVVFLTISALQALRG